MILASDFGKDMGGSGHGQAYWCRVCLEELRETIKDAQDS